MRSGVWIGADRRWRTEGLKDTDLRDAMRRWLDNEGAKGPVLDEVGILRGQARVDLLHVAPEHLHGFEIKSDVDNTVRLGRQVGFFSRAFDFCSLVAGERYLDPGMEKVPTWWGVFAVFADRRARCIRPPKPNPNVEPEALVQLLWRGPALDLLQEHGLAQGRRSLKRTELWEVVLAELPPEVIAAAVRGQLWRR